MEIAIREIRADEYESIGKLIVAIYSSLPGFPSPAEQPKYYEMLANIGKLSERDHTKVLVAVSAEDELLGGVVYLSDMAQYGSGGTATAVKNASGIRLLGVHPDHRGKGVGRALTLACIALAREKGHREVVLHTTEVMKTAWRLYESLGFQRSTDLDFNQKRLNVFGFRLNLMQETQGGKDHGSD